MSYQKPLKYDPITDPKKLYNRALYWLSKRDYSIADFARKLDGVCLDSDMKEALIAKLVENDWLSEQRYITAFVNSKISAGLGSRRIINDLKQHGIKMSDAEYYIESLDVDWFEQSKNTYTKKYGEEVIQDYKEKAKRFRYMQYRGFSIDEINYAIAPSDD